jgi:hypothetical protein
MKGRNMATEGEQSGQDQGGATAVDLMETAPELMEIFSAHARLEKAAQRRRIADEVLAECKAALKVAKSEKEAADDDYEALKVAVLDLVGACRKSHAAAGEDGEGAGELADEVEHTDHVMPAAEKPTAKQPAPADDVWKAVTLASLHTPAISPRVLKVLAEHEPAILTLGDLTAWQAAKGDWWGKDIGGVGPAAQEEIANAAEAYWMRRGGK